MSTEAMRAALAELLDAHDADYTGWSTHEMTEHWRRVKDAARAALAQRADEPTLLLDGQTPLQFALDELHAFQEATGCDTASDIAPAAPAYVPLSETEALMLFNKHYKTTETWADQLVAFARAIESLVVARMRGEGK